MNSNKYLNNSLIIFATFFSLVFSETHDVSITNFSFNPSVLEINQGDIVLWTNNGTLHRIVSDDGFSFESENLSNGDTFQHQFDTVGEFPYHCGIHASMTGNITVASVLENDNTSIKGFTLERCYPNPFNPTTTITYHVLRYANVTIDVYNMNGQLVKSLFSGFISPGQYTFSWDASGIASGAYIVKMISGGFIQTQQVMLVK